MAVKIAKYVILSIVGLFIILIVAVTVLDDEVIEASTGPISGPLLSAKHSVSDGIGGAMNAIGELVVSVIGGNDGNATPKVVQALPPAPAPATIAKPVETKSLAEIAAETQQEYAQRENAMAETIEQQPMSEMVESSSIETTTPPPSPVVETSNLDTTPFQSGAPPIAPDAATVEQSPPDPAPATLPSTDQLSAEEALLEGLTDQPANDVATLPSEALEENAPPESIKEDDPDSNGEKAYAEGLKYYSGDGVERNFGTAAQHFINAAEKGHSEAQYSLGLMNYVGQTGGQDFSNAAKWFQQAAESGHIQAQYNLGFLYYEGKGVAQDLKTAYGWIDRAAAQGYAKAIKARDALQKAMPEMFGG